jgi:DNA-binding CsgD family transcriptional regulator
MKTISQTETEVVPVLALREPEEGVIIMDSQFRIVGVDRDARGILRSGVSYGNSAETVSLPVYLEQIVSKFAQSDDSFLHANVDIGSTEYDCKVFRVQPLAGMAPGAEFALHLRRTPSMNHSLEKVVEMYRLTERESEILKGISLGLTSKALAKRMNISHNTVNSFLRMIMIKLGVTTRAGMVGLALNDRASCDTALMRAPRRREVGT